MHYLIGIDDTDNEFTRGTGFRTRDLTALIHQNGLGTVFSISRHQLFVHPEIPYTSHNSSACLAFDTENIELLTEFCKEYLQKESAEGSDVGLCIAQTDKISDRINHWGHRAKKEILSMAEARLIAREENIYLEGFLGTKGGIIGALAGVGLRKSGNDGRFFWLSGTELREIKGIYLATDLSKISNFDQIYSNNGSTIEPHHKIFVDEWLRPVLKNKKITIIVEPNINSSEYEWRTASKEYIKSISD